MSDPTTLLVISAVGVPPYSARGLKQTWAPISQAVNLQRDVNGTLIDLSPAQMQKYSSKIDCTDQQAPALDGVFPGTQVTVDCTFEWSYLTAGGSPARPVVAGSSRVEGDFTFYRPQLTMKITAMDGNFDEYAADYGWSVTLEEV